MTNYSLKLVGSAGYDGTMYLGNTPTDKQHVNSFLGEMGNNIASAFFSLTVGMGQIVRSTKISLKEVFIDGSGLTPTVNMFGGNSSDGFIKMTKLTLRHFTELQNNFCYNATALAILELPPELQTVTGDFCRGCDSLLSLWVPNATPPAPARSLTVTNSSAPAYVNGIILTGPGAAAWKAALPDTVTSPYRKLILG